jgi:3',5'-cyclic-AMP phosphodiesterase
VGRNFIKIILICSSFFWSCDDPFSYSPYEVNISESIRNTTQKNLQLIALSDTTSTLPFKIALLADTHYYFEELTQALKLINEQKDIAFIIVAGDVTENGLQKEFELFYETMASSRLPYLTVIGNHDYLSNGAPVYTQLFGPLNYSFTYHGVKFVMWDNVRWESNKMPDWQWLRAEINQVTDEQHSAYHHIVPVSHIPPYDPQMIDSAAAYHQLLRDHGIRMSVHGHKHEYSLEKTYGDDVEYLTIGSPQKHAYAILTIGDEHITSEKVDY